MLASPATAVRVRRRIRDEISELKTELRGIDAAGVGR